MQVIDVAETFSSIQGEGVYAGVPAIFLRLSHCNLDCRDFSYSQPDGTHTGCDSKHLWTKAQSITIHSLLDYWEQKRWLAALNKGAHLVITGGEPLLQQEALQGLISELDKRCGKSVFIEIETNATIKINPTLSVRFNQINASPKLPTSGNLKSHAYRLDVLQPLSENKKTIFKFVIVNEIDITEILHEYVIPLKICPQRVWLMPEGCTLKKIQRKTPMILKWCHQYHMNYSPRLQVLLNII